MSKKVSFVVPLFNHLAESQVMFYSLLESLPTGLDFEVIMVDDFSTDGTRAWLSGLADPKIKVILNVQNLGYAKSNNRGVAAAEGEYLCLLNNDLVFEPGWLEPMIGEIEGALNCGVVGNLQYRIADSTLDHAGVELLPSGQFQHIRQEQKESSPPYKSLAVTGACMLMRKDDFVAVGGFDEAFINGCEDYDFCFKIRDLGKSIYVQPRSRIKHHVSLSRGPTSLQDEKNSHYLYAKWRKNIKFELTRVWAGLLQNGANAYGEFLHGQLTQEFLATPQNAARVIAEAILLREEARWARELDSPPVNGDWMRHIQVKGLRYAPQINAFLVGGDIEVAVSEIKTARNFYVCGRLISDYDPSQTRICISVNGIQESTLPLENGLVVNVGVIDPILLPGLTNRFKVAAYFVDADGNRVGDASKTLLISHFVIDDQVVRLAQ